MGSYTSAFTSPSEISKPLFDYRDYNPAPIVAYTCNEEEANEAIEAGADVIMLDNIHGNELVSVSRRLKDKWQGKRKFLLETSGGIEESNLHEHAINGKVEK